MLFAATLVTWAATAALAGADLPADAWQMTGEGTWQIQPGAPAVIIQEKSGATASAVQTLPGAGTIVWRCYVEPSPTCDAAGLWFAAAPDLSTGYRLTLGGNPGLGGVQLHDASGALCWEDKYAPWTYYTPYVLEGVAEAGRVRVQVFRWDGTTLEAQSDWLEAPGSAPDVHRACGLYTHGIARFYRPGAAETPLSPIVPDSPSKLRLVTSDDSEWTIIGPGEWKWTTPDRIVLRQGADVPRSSVVNASLGGAEGTWRCRILLEKGAGGGGLLLRTDPQIQTGFNLWLGGNFGAGSLMLYRNPLGQLWCGPQNQWHYDTEYILEGTIKDGKVSGKLMSADGTLIAESPQFDILEEEKELTGHLGFMTYVGKGRFWDFSDATRTSVPAGAPQASVAAALGPEWTLTGGAWAWANEARTALRQEAKEGTAAAVNTAMTGSKGVYGATLTAEPGAQSVSLLFQVSPDMKEGFEARLENGVVLRTLSGRTLYEKPDFAWTPGAPYVVEGVVVTDRVSMRILDTAGNVLLKTDDFYVSDTNNTRIGGIGFQTINGAALVADWALRPLE